MMRQSMFGRLSKRLGWTNKQSIGIRRQVASTPEAGGPFLLRQQAILDQLAAILIEDAPRDCDEIRCKYRYDPDYDTITSQFAYRRKGKESSPALSPGLASKNLDLCEELRGLIILQTGTPWSSLTLTIDSRNSCRCDFEYS